VGGVLAGGEGESPDVILELGPGELMDNLFDFFFGDIFFFYDFVGFSVRN